MSNPTKSSVYRQLYHAANSLERRQARLSTSSLIDVSGTPMLDSRLIRIGLSLGVSLLALYAGVRALGKSQNEESEAEAEALKSFKDVTEQVDLPPSKDASKEEEEPSVKAEKEEEFQTPDEVLEEFTSIEEDLPIWRRIFEAIRSSSPTSETRESLPEPSTSLEISKPDARNAKTRREGASSDAAGEKLGESDPQDRTSQKKSRKDSTPIVISRGSLLSKATTSERKGQESNQLFTGVYSRLAKARLNSLELAWANLIVARKVSISGRMGKSMLPIVRNVIISRSKAHGLDPDMMLKVASMESGGDPNAVSSTGAIGVYQFTAATASAMGLQNRFDLDANVEAGILLTKQNTRSLPKNISGPLSAYISHQIGISSAKEVLSSHPSRKISSLSPRAQRAIRVNVGRNSKTVGEYLKANSDKLESSYAAQSSAPEHSGKISVFRPSSPSVNKASISTGFQEVAATNVLPEKVPSPSASYSPAKVSPPQAPTPPKKVARAEQAPPEDFASGEEEEKTSMLLRMENGLFVTS